MSFLNCNIWEINQFPKYGNALNRYTLATIFEYNSDTVAYQSNNFKLQIPEFCIKISESDKKFVLKNKEYLIKNKIPFLILLNSNDQENWMVDLSMSAYLIRRIQQEK